MVVEIKKTNQRKVEKEQRFRAISDGYRFIDTQKLIESVRYDKTTGRVWRRYNRYKGFAGWKIIRREEHQIAGYVIQVQNRKVLVQDLVWLLHYGSWPKGTVVALDGNLKNTFIDNLQLKDREKLQLGSWYMKYEEEYDRWLVQLKHEKFFRKNSTFKTQGAALDWAKSELRKYNQYAYAVMADPLYDSLASPVPIEGIYRLKNDGIYHVRVNVNGVRQHHGYFKNIEDSMEALAEAKAESEEIWGEGSSENIESLAWWEKARIKNGKPMVPRKNGYVYSGGDVEQLTKDKEDSSDNSYEELVRIEPLPFEDVYTEPKRSLIRIPKSKRHLPGRRVEGGKTRNRKPVDKAAKIREKVVDLKNKVKDLKDVIKSEGIDFDDE